VLATTAIRGSDSGSGSLMVETPRNFPLHEYVELVDILISMPIYIICPLLLAFTFVVYVENESIKDVSVRRRVGDMKGGQDLIFRGLYNVYLSVYQDVTNTYPIKNIQRE
jgi:hypothetical protein